MSKCALRKKDQSRSWLFQLDVLKRRSTNAQLLGAPHEHAFFIFGSGYTIHHPFLWITLQAIESTLVRLYVKAGEPPSIRQ